MEGEAGRTPVGSADVLGRGRRSFERQAWGDAYRQLCLADRMAALAAEDLELLAAAAYLCGRDDDCVRVWERAHLEHRARGDGERAARCAFWIAFCLFNRGESARARVGWPEAAGR